MTEPMTAEEMRQRAQMMRKLYLHDASHDAGPVRAADMYDVGAKLMDALASIADMLERMELMRND